MKENKSQRIKSAFQWLIFKGYGKNQEEIGRKIGYENKSSLSQILNGRVEVSDKFIEKLCALDNNLNKVWLNTGEGNMLLSSEEPAPAIPHVTQNNNQGDNNYNSDIIQLFKESQNQLTTSQAQLTTAQEQINQLITIIASKL